jgi:hypothetical protein
MSIALAYTIAWIAINLPASVIALTVSQHGTRVPRALRRIPIMVRYRC